MINPAGLIHPVETHPNAVIKAIASRDVRNAQKAAKTYKIEKAYGSYEELIADPEIDAVYISLPNGMHAGTSCLPRANTTSGNKLTLNRMGQEGVICWKACFD
jgi:predicted dehydrogenase